MAIVYGLLILSIVFSIITSSNSDPVSESEALLRLKASFTNSTSLASWIPGTEPCAGKWVGVVCENGVVSRLRLGKLGLSGSIDVNALASLSGLRSVAFMFNSFSGSIPKFYIAAALKGLYLTGNQFSGEIPADFFSNIKGLKKVWLSTNNFSGPIPSSLARLGQLMELHLEDNHFSGLIPSFEQKSLISLNISNNNLEGQVPSTLSRFSPNSFQGNARLCGISSPCSPPPSPPPPPPPPPPVAVTPPPARKNRTSNGVLRTIFSILIACAALLLLMLCVFFLMRRRRGEAEAEAGEALPVKKLVTTSINGFGSSIYNRLGIGDDLVFMNYEKGSFGMSDMMKAASEVMKNGATVGSSFKTTMASGVAVVVKRVREFNRIGRGEFEEKVRCLGNLRHKNLLPLLAYYNGKEEKLLVYEYQEKGSLLFLLHDEEGRSSATELNWPTRLRIIQGIARGLEFLHTELSSYELPHGNLKSSNVLLSVDYEPLLSDYGFWSLISQTQAARSLTAFKAPEACPITPKSDVYFLGVIILEILTRKFPSQYLSNTQGGTDLVMWARSAVAEGREAELLDPDVGNTEDFVQEMKQLVQIASACTEDDPGQRLVLREAVSRIEGVSDVQPESTAVDIQ